MARSRTLARRAILLPVIKGLGGDPAISVSPASHDFGSTPVGTTISQVFTIENTGSAPLILSLPVTVPSGFTVTVQPPDTIDPGDTSDFTVRANATVRGSFSGNISISNNSAETPKLIAITATVVQSYLIRADYDGLVQDPALSPVSADFGRVELTQPNSQFYLNNDLFCRPNGAGANFDTFALGADAAGNAIPVVNGTLVGVKVSSIASRGLFHLGTTKTGGASPRFEWEHVGGLFQLAGIRNTSGTFSAIVRNVANPVNLWWLWTDALYFGLNDEIVFVQAIAPTGSRFPTLTRLVIAGEWRNQIMAWSNDYPNLWTGKSASTLSAGEYANITDFLA